MRQSGKSEDMSQHISNGSWSHTIWALGNLRRNLEEHISLSRQKACDGKPKTIGDITMNVYRTPESHEELCKAGFFRNLQHK